MSVSVLRPTSAFDTFPPRKRTSSFSFTAPSPRPSKAPRLSSMGALKRTETCISLLDNSQPEAPPVTKRSTAPLKRSQTLPSLDSGDPFTPAAQRGRERQTRSSQPRRSATQQNSIPRSQSQSTTQVLSNASPAVRASTPPTKIIMPSAANPHAIAIYENCRTNSPLSPVKTILPARPVFPRSKPDTNLYKRALFGRMKTTDEGRRVLTMGPRLAISVWMATRDLERMVEDDLDANMVYEEPSLTDSPASLSRSWVVVEDWEMVDCSSDSPVTQ